MSPGQQAERRYRRALTKRTWKLPLFLNGKFNYQLCGQGFGERMLPTSLVEGMQCELEQPLLGQFGEICHNYSCVKLLTPATPLQGAHPSDGLGMSQAQAGGCRMGWGIIQPVCTLN